MNLRLKDNPVNYLQGMQRDLENFSEEFDGVVDLIKLVIANPQLPELQEVALVNYLKDMCASYEKRVYNPQMDFFNGYQRGMYVVYREILSMLRPDTEAKPVHVEKPTSEQLVEQLESDGAMEVTIMSDIVHGLDHEYKQLEEENRILKQGIRNTYETSQDIMAEQQGVINDVFKAIEEGRSISFIRDIVKNSVSTDLKGVDIDESEEGY